MKGTFICFHKRGFYFRVRGYGLTVRLAKGYTKLFSERNGYTRALYLFGIRIAALKP